MKRFVAVCYCFVSLFCSSQLMAQGRMAARMGDITQHGGTVMEGCQNVLIGSQPAARVGDMHVCQMTNPPVNPFSPPTPHLGGAILEGFNTVLIGGKPAARMGDMAFCSGPPDVIAGGCPTVFIGSSEDESESDHSDSEVIPSFELLAQNQQTDQSTPKPKVVNKPTYGRVEYLKEEDKNIVEPLTPQIEMGEKTIATTGNITIESKENHVLIVAGKSRISIDPAGGITIESDQINIKSTGDLNFQALNISMEAIMNFNIKSTIYNAQSASSHIIKGIPVMIN